MPTARARILLPFLLGHCFPLFVYITRLLHPLLLPHKTSRRVHVPAGSENRFCPFFPQVSFFTTTTIIITVIIELCVYIIYFLPKQFSPQASWPTRDGGVRKIFGEACLHAGFSWVTLGLICAMRSGSKLGVVFCCYMEFAVAAHDASGFGGLFYW